MQAMQLEQSIHAHYSCFMYVELDWGFTDMKVFLKEPEAFAQEYAQEWHAHDSSQVIYGLPPLPPSSGGIVRLGSGRPIGEGIPVIAESELPRSYHELI